MQTILYYGIKVCSQLRSDDVLKPLPAYCYVVAVRVHLNQLDISSVEIHIKKVEIKLHLF